MKSTKILASLTIAQAILESNWGKSQLSTIGNALFGIKATSVWIGRVYNSNTKECYDGVNMQTVNANFRAYDSWEESIADHSTLLTQASRYKKVVGETDYKLACQYIKEAGYATDPDYTGKLIGIIETNKLYEYDKEVEKVEISKITILNIENGYEFTVDGFLKDNKNYGSIREVLEAFGYTVGWEAEKITVQR
jgi:flagellum-specific peptidoglycan hydrolase FlgJ